MSFLIGCLLGMVAVDLVMIAAVFAYHILWFRSDAEGFQDAASRRGIEWRPMREAGWMALRWPWWIERHLR
jgi:hypothetical protein